MMILKSQQFLIVKLQNENNVKIEFKNMQSQSFSFIVIFIYIFIFKFIAFYLLVTWYIIYQLNNDTYSIFTSCLEVI